MQIDWRITNWRIADWRITDWRIAELENRTFPVPRLDFVPQLWRKPGQGPGNEATTCQQLAVLPGNAAKGKAWRNHNIKWNTTTVCQIVLWSLVNFMFALYMWHFLPFAANYSCWERLKARTTDFLLLTPCLLIWTQFARSQLGCLPCVIFLT